MAKDANTALKSAKIGLRREGLTMKKTLLLTSYLALVCLVQAVGAADTEKYKDKQIEELSKKYFYYSNSDGKESLTLTTTPTVLEYESASDGTGKNIVVKLSAERAAIALPGTSLILAFLDCPSMFCSDDAVMALFSRDNLNVPLCFSRRNLMYCKYCSIKSIEARKTENRAFHIAVTLEGADAGDFWTHLLFLHVDRKCKVTLLSKFWDGYGDSDTKENPGTKIRYRFLDNKTVEVMTAHVAFNNELEEKVGKGTRKKYHLDQLYNNPKSRVFLSKAEKAMELLKIGFDVNTQTEDGETFLIWAAEDGSSEIVKECLDKGADINAKSKDGHTALMYAAYGGHKKVVTLLLKRGADVNAKTKDGWTALKAAREGEDPTIHILQILKAHGAKE
jgi:hypothetical protein